MVIVVFGTKTSSFPKSEAAAPGIFSVSVPVKPIGADWE
jgi:hypothetical protein